MFAYLLAAVLVETLFFVVLSPLLPVYAQQLRLGRSGAGVMSACYAIGYGLAAVPAGTWSAARAAGVSLGGVALVGASCAGFALARHVVLLDAARLCTGAGAAAVWAGSIPSLQTLGRPRGSREDDRLGVLGRQRRGLCWARGGGGGDAHRSSPRIPRPQRPHLRALVAARHKQRRPSAGGGAARSPRRSLGAAVTGDRHGRSGDGGAADAGLRCLGGVLLPLRLRGLGVAEVGIATAYLLAAVLEVIVNPVGGALV